MLNENRLREKSGKRRRLSFFFLKLAADLRIREANCQGRFVLYENSCTQCGIQWRMHTVWMVHTVACQTADTHSVNRKAHCVWHWCSALASVARTRSAYMCVCTSVEILRVITVLHSVGVLQWILHIQTHLRSGSNGNLLDRLSMLCIRMHSRLAFDSCFIKTPQPPLV